MSRGLSIYDFGFLHQLFTEKDLCRASVTYLQRRVMEDIILTPKEHKVLNKFQKRLEKRYNVKIQMPGTVTCSESDVIFASIFGEACNIERVKKFLSEKVDATTQKVECQENITLITLSDSEEEPTSRFSKENSVCIVEDSYVTKNSNFYVEDSCVTENCSKFEDKVTACNESLEDSVCIIEPSLTNSGWTSDLKRNTTNYKTKYKENREKHRDSKMNDKVRSKGVLPSSAAFEDAELCEVTSTSGEVVLRNMVSCEESMHLSKEASVNIKETEEFIPLCRKRKSHWDEKEKESTKDSHDNLSRNVRKKDEGLVPNESLSSRLLRPIVIDGSNVAMEHGKVSCTFSSKGIQIAVDYFLRKGHKQVTAFVPKFRRVANRRLHFPTTDSEILDDLAKKQLVVFTPSRRVNGKCIASYDDRFIVQLASANGGIIVSNDNYRDLLDESESFKEAIEKRLLMFCFVGDMFMIPDDPLGRDGPSLSEFLSFPPDTEKT